MNNPSEGYTKKQGFSAFLLFSIVFLLAFFHGSLSMSGFPITVLKIGTFIFPLLDLMVLGLLLRFFKDSVASIGLQRKNLSLSFTWGTLFLCIQLVCYVLVSFFLNDGHTIVLGTMDAAMVLLFFISALAEETIYRGYIETRLTTFLHNRFLCSVITLILFVVAHYPVKWMSGAPWNALTFPHVLLLITLHFSCSFTYRKSNCLWGAVFLHVFYNLFSAFIHFV